MDKPDFFKWYLGAAICNGRSDLVFQKMFCKVMSHTLSCLSCHSFHLYISGQKISENRLPGKWTSALKIRSMTDLQSIPVH